MAQGFRSSISLDGGKEVQQQLQDIGKTGEDAFRRVEQASAKTNLGGFGQSLQNTFRQVGTAVAPARAALGQLGDSVGEVRNSFSAMADRVIPHWRAVLAIGAGAGLAGMVSFVTSAAKATDEIGDQAAALGLSVERFQEFKIAANTAGVSTEQFLTSFARLAAAASTESAKQLDSLIGIGKSIAGSVEVGTTTVLRGIDDTKKAAIDAGVQVFRAGESGQNGLIKVAGAVKEQVSSVASLLQTALAQAGLKSPLIGLADSLQRAATGTSEAAVTLRKQLRDLGADLPAATVGEALDNLADTADQKLGRLVQLWEATDGKLRRRKLEDVFLDLADKIAAIEDPAQRTTAVVGVFGSRIGARLVPLLSQARDGILEVGEAFTRAGIAFNAKDTAIGDKFADQLDILETAISNAKNLLALPIADALQPVLVAATEAVRDSAGAIREWATTFASSFKPAIADFVKLIQGANKEQIQTSWVRDLVSVFQSLRSFAQLGGQAIGLVTLAFHGLSAAADLALAPINSLFGTHFRGDVLLAIAGLLKLVGAFAAIASVIALARAALVAFTILAARTPFGLLAAAVALFVAKMTEGTPAAKKFWDAINGDSGEAAAALGQTAASAADFGKAASDAERSVAGALGVTTRLDQAAGQTAAKFVTVADAIPKATAGLPVMLRGVNQVGAAVDSAKGKFIELGARVREVAEAPKVAPNALAPAAAAPAAGRPLDLSGAIGPVEHQIGALAAAKRDVADLRAALNSLSSFAADQGGVIGTALGQLANSLRLTMSILTGDFPQAWEDFKKIAVDDLTAIAGAVDFLGGKAAIVANAIGEKIRAGFDVAAQAVQTRFNSAFNAVATTFTSLLGRLGSGISGFAAQAGNSLGGFTAPGLAVPDLAGTFSGIVSGIDSAKSKLVDLVSAIPAAIGAAVNQLSELVAQAASQAQEFVAGQIAALNEIIAATLQGLSDLVIAAVQAISVGIATAFEGLQSSVGTVFGWIRGQIDSLSSFLSGLLEEVTSIVSAIGGAIGAAAGAVVPGFAGGGIARGPGGPTGDKIPIWVSAGEAITRARAVTYYGPELFHALNRMVIPRSLLQELLGGLRGFSLGGMVEGLSAPIVPHAMPRFALGGIVAAPAAAAGPSRTLLPLVLDGRTFPVIADDDIADSLVRSIRKRNMLSAGRR